MLLQWLRRWRQRTAARSQRPGRARICLRKWCYPRLECLEDRVTPSAVTWKGGSGDWGTPSNWSSGSLPGATDDVTIDLPGITVTHSSGSDTVRSLTMNDPFNLSGGTLTVTGNVAGGNVLEQNGNLFTLSGGTLSGATVSAATTITGTAGALTGVTLAGTLDMTTSYGGGVSVNGGLMLDGGIVNIGLNQALTFNGTMPLGGKSGTVNFTDANGANRILVAGSGNTLTIGANITIQGNSGNIDAGNSAFVNLGTISANGGGTISTVGATNFSGGALTGGTWKVFNNSTLQFTNGSIATNAATILLDGVNSHLTSINSSNGQTSDALTAFAANAATGSLTIQNGRNVTTPGDFSNAGIMVLGSASTFSVTGNYTQSSAASLEADLGGSPASGQFGRLNASGTAALGGMLRGRIVNGYGPQTAAGDSFQVVTFTNRGASDFASFDLQPQGAVSLTHSEFAANVTLNTLTSVLQFSQTSPSIQESEGALVTFTVTRTIGSIAPIMVSYNVTGGTAVNGTDYSFSPGTLSWANGDTAPKTFTITIHDDGTIETNKTVNLALSSPTNGSIVGTAGTAQLSILETSGTTTTLNTSPSVVYGTAVTFTATVSANSGSAAPTAGSVDFFDTTTNTDLGPGTFGRSSGVASTWTFTTGVRTFNVTSGDTITGTYFPGTGFLGSNGTTTQVVSPLAATWTTSASNKTYSQGADSSPLSTGSGSFLAADNVTAVYSRVAGETVLGGPYHITATLHSTTLSDAQLALNYTITNTGNSFTITPLAAAWTTKASTKTYGAADPSLLTTGSGNFLAADNVTAVYSRVAGETVLGGPYHITATLSPSTVLSNYTITNTGNSFTITPLAAAWTTKASTKTYGAADPSPLTTGNGTFLAADNVTAVYSRVAGETVLGGPYHITATLSPGSVLSNYTITNTGNSFSIIPLAAGGTTTTVRTSQASVVYGTAVILTATVSANSGSAAPTVGSVDFTDTTTSADLGPGTFGGSSGAKSTWIFNTGIKTLNVTTGDTITATYSPGTGFSGSNGTTTQAVSPLAASVTPSPASKTYGTADPTFAGTQVGFLAGDNVTATYKRTAGEAVQGGTYTISATLKPAGVLSDYNITYNTAAFTINTRAITVTATTNTKTFDGDTSAQAMPTVTSVMQLAPGDVGSFTGTYNTPSVDTGKMLTPAGTVMNSEKVNVTADYNITFIPVFTGVITAGAPAKLAFVGVAGAALADLPVPTFQVDVEDRFGNLVKTDSSQVAVAAMGPVGSTPSVAPVSAAAVRGVATFSDLRIEALGNFSLYATDAALPRTTFSPMVVTFQDNFKQLNGSLLSRDLWHGHLGSPSIEDNTAVGSGHKNYVVARNLVQRDVSVTGTLTVGPQTAVGQGGGLTARSQLNGEGNYYYGALFLTKDGGLQASIRIMYPNGQVLKVLTVGKTVQTTSGTVEFEVVGSSLKLFFNDQVVASTHDRTLRAGSVGMRVNPGSSWSNFVAAAVNATTASLPVSDNLSQPGDGSQLSQAWTDQQGNFTIQSGAAVDTDTANVSVRNGLFVNDVTVEGTLGKKRERGVR